jgi:predicted PurR-regulated permease PerM
LAALLTLIIIFSVFAAFFSLIVPPLIQQIEFLSELNFSDVSNQIFSQYPSLQSVLNKTGDTVEVNTAVNEQLNKLFNLDNISLIINNLLSYFTSFLGGVFCVLFITFYLLKDQTMVSRTFLLLTPHKFEGEMVDILRTSKKMLSKYFTGLTIDVLIVGLLAGLLMWLLGIKNALIIGCIAGLFNVIPYIGPIITLVLALFLGVSGCIEAGHFDLIQPTITKIIIALLSINLLDALIFQPYIFSSTVKAHPLEIFLVILMAGTLAGIGGMVVAIPVYTLIRIVAKEFLTQFKFFRKISEKIEK